MGVKTEKLLCVKDLHASLNRKEILSGVNFEVKKGETVVLMGPNGAGKSSLVRVQSGEPNWKVTGEIKFNGEDITRLSVTERARRGIFVAGQNPIEIPGVTTTELINAALKERGEDLSLDEVRERILEAAKKLGMNIWFSERELVGFSGGERKKNEILQMLVLRPKLAILDEIDSGLDVNAAEKVSKILNDFQKETGVSYLVITHNMRALKHLKVAKTLVMDNGAIAYQGGAEVAKKVLRDGFKDILGGVK